MAQRLTVSIPDALYERLQKVKSELNISGVCASSLERAVVIEEMKKGEKNMDNVLARLRLEKEEFEETIAVDAFAGGQEDALELSYQEFLDIENDDLNEDFMKWLIRTHSLENLNEENKQLFISNWKEGVLSIWNDLKLEL